VKYCTPPVFKYTVFAVLHATGIIFAVSIAFCRVTPNDPVVPKKVAELDKNELADNEVIGLVTFNDVNVPLFATILPLNDNVLIVGEKLTLGVAYR